jgi:F1F0 ATPase subunit 2
MLVRLEVDGHRVTLLILALHVTGGIAVGALYFTSLWWNAAQFGGAGRVRTLIASIAARFVLLGTVLTAVSFEGALPLLATAGGILIARAIVLRRLRVAAP